jgi:DNA polymerase (family 10)
MKNAEIASAFDELANLYELDGAVVYRVVAYRNAAKAIRESGASVAEMAAQGRAAQLPGVGKTIAEKIDALIAEGDIPSAVKLRQRIPSGLVQVTRIPGLGPKRARLLHQELGVETLDDLRKAAEEERLRTVAGFGPKAEQNILAALEAGADGEERTRTLLSKALVIGEELVEGLRDHPASIRVELAGSARRWAETCKDLDIVACATDGDALLEAFAGLPAVDEVSRSGSAGAKAVTHQGIPVDLRIVPEAPFGNLLQHFTGSGRHNEALRTAAVKKGIHVSEYGVAVDETSVSHACGSEEEVYALLGMAYIEPELREDRGELEAARAGTLPDLIQVSDIRGDLHSHTIASDGRGTITEMAEAARARGYEYLAVTDHSATHGFGNHVTPDELKRQIERVAEVDARLEGIRVLAGTETNVLPDGSVDYEDDLLMQLDWVVASVHTSFRMSEADMTKRIVTALENPLVDVLGHPTGRMIGRREGYAVDMDAVIDAAARTGTFLEINANPNRRDLDDVYARAAARAGVKLLIDSDAHGTETLGNMRYGVATARRAWLAAADVANTRDWAGLSELRKRRPGP